MQTRSATDYGAIHEVPKQSLRLPLRETSSNDGTIDFLPIEIPDKHTSPVKTATKLLPRTIISSPARRVPRALSSPAKRQVTKARLPPVLSNATADTSSPRRALGSPMRKTSTSLSISPTKLSLSTLELNVIGESTGSNADATLQLQQSLKMTSPLKSPARRRQISAGEVNVSKEQSSLRSPVRSTEPQLDTVVMSQTVTRDSKADSSVMKKLSTKTKLSRRSSLTPEKAKHTKSSASSTQKRKRSSGSTRSKIAMPEQLFQDDDDEIALLSYTPLKTPARPTYAQSPPSEDTIEDNDDLWTPSVPTTLSRSFSRLSLSPTPIRNEASHVFFDDDGEPIPTTKDYVFSSPEKSASVHQVKSAEVIVYVDSKTLDMTQAAGISDALTDLGAKTLCRWNWNPETQDGHRRLSKVGLTHVVFCDGAIRTLKKVMQARKLGMNVHCVGLSWIEECQHLQTLNVEVEAHKIDVDSELSRLNNAQTVSIEPSVLLQPKLSVPAGQASPTRDYIAPVKFADDDEQNVFSARHASPQKSANKSSSNTSPAKNNAITDFESKQLALARRNSAKFRPPVSSPLAKKAWRA